MEEKRIITIKQKDCNPLFKRWLKELVEEAESRKLKSSKIYFKALESLEKYPLTLYSGHDCSILESFGVKICQVLDERLEKHLKNQSDIDQSLGFKDQVTYLKDKENEQLIEFIKNVEDSLLPGLSDDSLVEDQEDENSQNFDDVLVAQISSEEISGDEFDLLVNNEPSKKKVRLSPPKEILHKPVTPPYNFSSSPDPYESPKRFLDNYVDSEDEFDKLVNQGLSPVSTVPKKNSIRFRRSQTFNGIPADKQEPTFSPIPKFVEAAATSSPFPTKQNDSELERLVAKYNLSPIKKDEPIKIDEPIESKVKTPEKTKPAKKTKQLKIVDFSTGISTTSTQPSRSLQRHKSAVALRTVPSRIEEETEEAEEVQIYVADLDNISDYNVVLLVDTQETTGGRANSTSDILIKGLTENSVALEVRHLNVGDFLWIAKHKTDATKEYVLPYIIERKRVDDLSSSIKDGRFHEQKFRLKQCGIENVIYLIEAQAKTRQMGTGIPFTTLLQAATNTQIHSKFTVKFTESHQHTILYLTVMTSFLENIFKNNSPLQFKLRNFERFNKSSVKQKRLTVRETFIKQLLSLKGLSVEIAMAIVSKYPTPRDLYMKYREGSREDNEKLLTLIQVGSLKRKISANISSAVYYLYTSDKVY